MDLTTAYLTTQKVFNVLFTSSSGGLKGWQVVLRSSKIFSTLRSVVTVCKKWWPNNGGKCPHNDSSKQQLFYFITKTAIKVGHPNMMTHYFGNPLHIVGHNKCEKINTKTSGIMMWMPIVFQPTVYSIKNLHCRSQYFNWMKNSVHCPSSRPHYSVLKEKSHHKYAHITLHKQCT